jgi:hypothetical protein
MSTAQTQDFPFLTQNTVDEIFALGELTRADRERIKAMLLNPAIKDNELKLIEKVMKGVVNGILDVLD